MSFYTQLIGFSRLCHYIAATLVSLGITKKDVQYLSAVPVAFCAMNLSSAGESDHILYLIDSVFDRPLACCDCWNNYLYLCTA